MNFQNYTNESETNELKIEIKNPKIDTDTVVGPFLYDWFKVAKEIIDPNTSLAFCRYGDGEDAVINGRAINAQQDNWKIEAGSKQLSVDLLNSLKGHRGQNFYYGFASIDSLPSLNHYLSITEQDLKFITYANLFVNSNYRNTLRLLSYIQAGKAGNSTVIIANVESRKNADSFQGLKHFKECPDDAPNWYEANREQLMADWKKLANSFKNTLFIISCGPLAKVAVSIMWNENPQNKYIDFGSSVDEILKGRKTRAYMNHKTRFAKQVDPAWKLDSSGKAILLHDYI